MRVGDKRGLDWGGNSEGGDKNIYAKPRILRRVLSGLNKSAFPFKIFFF